MGNAHPTNDFWEGMVKIVRHYNDFLGGGVEMDNLIFDNNFLIKN